MPATELLPPLVISPVPPFERATPLRLVETDCAAVRALTFGDEKPYDRPHSTHAARSARTCWWLRCFACFSASRSATRCRSTAGTISAARGLAQHRRPAWSDALGHRDTGRAARRSAGDRAADHRAEPPLEHRSAGRRDVVCAAHERPIQCGRTRRLERRPSG